MRLRRQERGALLGIVLIMLMVLMAASVFAFFSLRTDSGATAQDRMQRQLFDCAEQGLAIGKTTFSTTTATPSWPAYYLANNTNGTNPFPSPPFPQNTSSTPVTGYPLRWCAQGCTYGQVQVALGATDMGATVNFDRVVAIYNNPGDTQVPLNSETDNQTMVWSQCTDPQTGQKKVVQALLLVPPVKNGNYFGQAGFGYNNSGNTNNTPK
jgi:Tfp pilus assembly protein PilX